MVYLLAWTANGIVLAIQECQKSRSRLAAHCLLFVFAAIAFMRGDVGVDTVNYETMLRDLAGDYAWDGREPGFIALGWILVRVMPTEEVAVRAIGIVFFSLLALFVAKSERNERFLLLAYVLPAFAYHYSMNALRIGIGSAILLLAVQQSRRRRGVLALSLGMGAILFHYSLAASVLIIGATQRRWFRKTSLLALLSVGVGVGLIVLAMEFYVAEKVLLYTEARAPGELSGLSKVAPVVLLLIGVGLGRLRVNEKAKLMVVCGGSCVVGWIIARYSYAGLRLLDLVSFVAPLSILASYSRIGRSFDASLKAMVLIAGLLSAGLVYRGFLETRDEGLSPFLPYRLRQFEALSLPCRPAITGSSHPYGVDAGGCLNQAHGSGLEEAPFGAA